jgi:hypothetical protein
MTWQDLVDAGQLPIDHHDGKPRNPYSIELDGAAPGFSPPYPGGRRGDVPLALRRDIRKAEREHRATIVTHETTRPLQARHVDADTPVTEETPWRDVLWTRREAATRSTSWSVWTADDGRAYAPDLRRPLPGDNGEITVEIRHGLGAGTISCSECGEIVGMFADPERGAALHAAHHELDEDRRARIVL